jgi:cytidylate kinase
LTDKIILDSRLGFYAQPSAFKILLEVDETVASQRILGDKRATDKFANTQEALQQVQERNLHDAQRYKKLYDIDVRDYKNYTLVIDTSERTPAEIVDIILQEFQAWKLKKCIAETPQAQKALSKAKHKKSLLRNILLLVALVVIAGIRIFTTFLSMK